MCGRQLITTTQVSLELTHIDKYFLFVKYNLQIPGLMPRQFDRVKLHMTVLNTIF
mgnify:CR=1 FL=1